MKELDNYLLMIGDYRKYLLSGKSSQKVLGDEDNLSKMNIPKLRFKGFSGEWQAKKTSSLLQRVSKPVAVKLDKEYQQIGIRSHGKGIFHKELVTGAELGNKRVFWVEENTFVVNIVFAWEQAVAKTSSAEKGMIASHRFPMYKTKENEADINYIFRLFLTDKGKHYLGLASPGGAGRNKTLGQKNFEELDIIVPDNVKEQTKIADFLTAIDDRISQLSQKCDGLAQYKKGVMQKIFSQELRFKDEKGRAFPAWEEKRLGDVLAIGSGKNYKHLDTGDIPVYGTGGYMLSVNDYLYNGESVCIGRKGTIDKPVFLRGKFWTIDTLFFTHSFNNVIPKFIYYVFLGIDWKNHNEASGVPSLSKSTIETIKLRFPSMKEQEKIAGFLSAVDERISQAQAQLDALKQYKQGLLQQMFV